MAGGLATHFKHDQGENSALVSRWCLPPYNKEKIRTSHNVQSLDWLTKAKWLNFWIGQGQK
uniref:Uncharacterized protein n=1 Tax=Arundo donax TaxID=35708 RepID=A0A0A9GM55_ARUDO